MKNLTNIPKIELSQVVGLDSQTDAIYKQLLDKEKNIVVITGQAGIGKTTVALSFVSTRKYISLYKNIAWVSVTDKSIKEDFINAFISSNKEIRFKLRSNKEANFNLLMQYLKTQKGNTLLVIDNANNAKQLEEIRQDLIDLKIDVIITTRTLPENYNLFSMQTLSPSNAFKLFSIYYTKEKNDEILNRILKKIDYNSLLIIMLAKATQNNDKLKLEKLLKIVSDRALDFPQLDSKIKIPTYYKKEDFLKEIRFKDYFTSIFKISDLSNNELFYLKILLILPDNKDFSFDFLAELLFIKDEKKLEFNENLNALVVKGWLLKRYDNSEAFYQIHKLVKFSLNTLIEVDLKSCNSTFWRVSLKLSYADKKINRLQEKILWSEIGESMVNYFYNEKIMKNISQETNLALLYNNLALCYQDLSKYEKALKYQKIALAMNQKTLKSPHISIAKNYNNLSSIYRDVGDVKRGIENQIYAIQIKEKILDSNNASLARSYNNLSLLYSDIRAYKNALELQLKAIIIRQTFKEEPNSELANSFNNLSTIYNNLKDSKNALRYQLKAINLFQKIYKTPHPNMATALSNLALLYNLQGNTEKALESHLLALDIRQECLNKNHKDLENSHYNLSAIYMKTAQFVKALDSINKSIEILKNIFPPEHEKIKFAEKSKKIIVYNLTTIN